MGTRARLHGLVTPSRRFNATRSFKSRVWHVSDKSGALALAIDRPRVRWRELAGLLRDRGEELDPDRRTGFGSRRREGDPGLNLEPWSHCGGTRSARRPRACADSPPPGHAVKRRAISCTPSKIAGGDDRREPAPRACSARHKK